MESLDNLRPGDCIVCFSKNDIYSISRQIEAKGLECAVIYGSLPPGESKEFYFFFWEDVYLPAFLKLTEKIRKIRVCLALEQGAVSYINLI